MDAVVRKNGNTLAVDVRRRRVGHDARRPDQDAADSLQPAEQRREVHDATARVTLQVARDGGRAATAIEFVVTDTGIGLTAEQKGRLFRPFAQADTSIVAQVRRHRARAWRWCGVSAS